MEIMITIIRLLAFVFSEFGYMRWLQRKTSLKTEFMPLLIFASQGLIIFLAGILNFMTLATLAMFALGIYFAIYSLIRHEEMKRVFSAGIIFLCLLSGYYLYLFRGQQLVDYDNYTHWGLVVRVMLSNGRLPNFQDTLIQFQSYPLGSASFIYYFCKIVSSSESAMMFAQALIIFSCITVFFAFVKNNRIVNFALIAFGTLFFLTSNTSLYDLLVDTLLSMVGIASFLIAYEYRDDLKKSALYVTPLLCFLMAIKNSGIYFVLIIGIFLLVHSIRTGTIRSTGAKRMLSVLFVSPALLVFLWGRHVNLVFTSGLTARHSMSLANFKKIFSTKTPEDVKGIVSLFLSKQIEQVEILYYVIFLVLVILLTRKLKLKVALEEKSLLFTVLFSFVGYQLGLLGMYMFTMPGVEATNLAGYGRYYETIVMFIIGLTLLYFIEIINAVQTSKKNAFTVMATSGIIVLSLLFIRNSGLSLKDFGKRDISDSWRVQLETIISDYNIPQNKSYFISVNDTRRRFFYYLGQYCLLSTKVEALAPTGEESFEKLASYDYLILLEENEAANAYVESHFGEDAGEKVIDLTKYR